MTVFDQLSVQPVINAAGRLTALGGATLSEPVTAAMVHAAHSYCDLAELKVRAGRWIAEQCGGEDAWITPGAGAGVALMVAAVVAGTDPVRVAELPSATGGNQVLIQSGHMINFGAPIEQMVRLGGGGPVTVGSANKASLAELDSRLADPETVAVLHVISHHAVQKGGLSLRDVVAAADAHGIPVLVDAAAEEDLRASCAAGASLVAYSGGKAIEGPTSGFVLGRSEFIAGCRAQEVGIGRTMKVGRETIAGLLAALDRYLSRDAGDEERRRRGIAKQVLAGIARIPGLEGRLEADEARANIVRVAVTPASDSGVSVQEVVDRLRSGDPAVYVREHHVTEGRFTLDPRTLGSGDVPVLLERLRDVVSD